MGLDLIGYRYKEGKISIEPEETEKVRYIFDLYLSRYGAKKLQELIKRERKTIYGNTVWTKSSIKPILTNCLYIGALLFQETYMKNHLDKRSYNNKGILSQYYVEDSHKPIISKASCTVRFHS